MANNPNPSLEEIFEAAEQINFDDFHQAVFYAPGTVSALDQKLCKHPRNDLGNARRLIARHGANIKYISEQGWHGWTGQCWSLEHGDQIVHKAAQNTADCLRYEFYAVAAHGPYEDEPPKKYEERLKAWHGFARNSGNKPRISAMITEAQPHLECSPKGLNRKPYFLNVQNGTLDLKAPDNGREDWDGITLEKHNPEDLITKLAEVEYDPAATCPRFRQFISEIQPDLEIELFLQRWCGYCLTGSMQEQIILMFYGTGSNGKSVLMSLMKRILGSYAQVLPFASLLHDDKRRGAEASPDLAQLPGVRLVTAAEPESGAKFSESLIKQITGGEEIKARHLHKGFFEFKPECKVMLSFNNKPIIRGQDEGIWRRIALVPFAQRYVEAHELTASPGAKLKDKDLEAKLWEERSGILNWMLDGYRLWEEKGLCIPQSVRAATSQYRDESSPVREFLSACTQSDPAGMVKAGMLYEAYTLWAADSAMEAQSQTWFGYRMKDLNIQKHRDGRNIFYVGLKLTKEMADRLNG